MKTRFLKSILMIVMMTMTLPMLGQDYLTITLKDGKEERHLMSLIKELFTSKYDKEGVLQSDYVTQVLSMKDTIYYYDMADIESISFKSVSEEQIIQNVESTFSTLVEVLEDCESLDDVKSKYGEIEKANGVEKVSIYDNALVVRIKDWRDIVILDIPEKDNVSAEWDVINHMPRLVQGQSNKAPQINQSVRVVIADQNVKNENKEYVKSTNVLHEIEGHFKDMGYDVDYIPQPSLDFFRQDIFNYDVVMLTTHGMFLEGKHWFATGEEIGEATQSWVNSLFDSEDYWGKTLLFETYYNYIAYDLDLDFVRLSYVPEERGGKKKWILYTLCSEDYIGKSPFRFKNEDAIIFTNVCESLDNNQSVADIFLGKGASDYLGYEGTTYYGEYAGGLFFRDYMLNGKSVESAFDNIPENEKVESQEEGAILKHIKKKDYKPKFIIKTVTAPSSQVKDELVEDGKHLLSFYGFTSILDEKKWKEDDKNDMGFEVSLNPNMDNATKISVSAFSDTDNYNGNKKFWGSAKVEPGKTYYYRAYTFDGMNYNYGDPCSFTINGGNTPDDRMKVGDSFTVPTKEGTEVVYTITKKDASGNTCKVGFNAIAASSGVKRLAGSNISPAIDLETVGTITIPELAAGYKVTALGKNAFKGCKKLTAVNLPESILEIGQSAAEGCSGLTSISIPKNVEIIKANAYGGCGNVTGVYCEISDPFAIGINVFLTEDEESRGVTNSSIFTNATLYVPVGSKGKYSSMEGWNKFKYIEENTDEEDNAPEGIVAIDLGLPSGTKWASCNVGATKPEEYGGYYAWGETEEKEVYDWSTYVHADGYWESIHDIGSNISGTEYDVAHVKWGGDWCMPTHDEQRELVNNCTSEWTTLNGVNGRKFTSRINGNSIFLPAAGLRRRSDSLDGSRFWSSYWSSTHYQNDRFYAWHLPFDSFDVRFGVTRTQEEGYSVRPVIHSTPTLVDLTLSITDPITALVYDKVPVQITTGNGSYTAESDNKDVAIASVDEYATIIINCVSAGTATITVTDTKSGQTAIITIVVNDRFIDPDNLLPDYFTQAGEGTIPEGWFVMFFGEERPSQTSYSSGPRMFEFAFGGDFTKGIYFRQGYVEYGSTEGYPLTLESGKGYLFNFTTAMWKDNGNNTRFEIINPDGEVVFVQVVDNSPNLNGRTDAVYGASKHSFLFRPDVSGNYVIRWSATKTEIGEPDYLNKEYMEIILANPQVKYVPTE